MESIHISRYPGELMALSSLHHLDDALDLLSFLKAEDFVATQLRENHSKPVSLANKIARRIASHANLAVQYAALSLESPAEISFLPGYYCILNLAKCISLSGPYSPEFDHHSRWHGATYDPRGKASKPILNDEVTVRCGGALALFYKTLTNQVITTDKTLKLKDFYHLIPGIGSELSIVTGRRAQEWYVRFSGEKRGGDIIVQGELRQWDKNGKEKPYKGNVRSIPCLKGFNKKPNANGIFVKKFAATPGLDLKEEARKVVSTEFLNYRNENGPYVCYEQGTSLPMPQEFASALAFFHLSSVCRYCPEFIGKLSRSKSWPMVLMMRRQTLYYFMSAVWSYIIQQDYILKSS